MNRLAAAEPLQDLAAPRDASLCSCTAISRGASSPARRRSWRVRRVSSQAMVSAPASVEAARGDRSPMLPSGGWRRGPAVPGPSPGPGAGPRGSAGLRAPVISVCTHGFEWHTPAASPPWRDRASSFRHFAPPDRTAWLGQVPQPAPRSKARPASRRLPRGQPTLPGHHRPGASSTTRPPGPAPAIGDTDREAHPDGVDRARPLAAGGLPPRRQKPEQAPPAGPARSPRPQAPPAPRRSGATTRRRPPHTLNRISSTSPSITS